MRSKTHSVSQKKSTRNVICSFICLCMCSKCPLPERTHALKCHLRTHATFSETVMVSVGVSKLGCTRVVFFVEPG